MERSLENLLPLHEEPAQMLEQCGRSLFALPSLRPRQTPRSSPLYSFLYYLIYWSTDAPVASCVSVVSLCALVYESWGTWLCTLRHVFLLPLARQASVFPHILCLCIHAAMSHLAWGSSLSGYTQLRSSLLCFGVVKAEERRMKDNIFWLPASLEMLYTQS